jgi:phosphoribosyl 1,2-cyclic phosphodiesterase
VIACSLQSGSNGNAIYVEAGDARLLFDAGISGSEAARRLQAHGREIRGVDALFISHDHSDHVRCAGVYHRRFGIPIHATQATLDRSYGLGELDPGRVRRFRSGERIEIGRGVIVYSVKTPHDAADGVAFVVEHDGKRLGILTDLGRPFPMLSYLLPRLDAVFLESNYDPEMLEKGGYPAFLKARIRGGRGHLSNFESAALLRDAIGERLRWAAIAHLSEENNVPELALDTHRRHIGRLFPLHHASRYGASEMLEV